jgi:hypothetical protein
MASVAQQKKDSLKRPTAVAVITVIVISAGDKRSDKRSDKGTDKAKPPRKN